VDSGGYGNAEGPGDLGLVVQDAALGSPGPRTVLAVGSGKDALPAWQEQGYRVVRLDIDASMEPDIVASMTDMGPIGPFDVVYCSHSLEHVYPHEVPVALAEFYRVLRPGGKALVLVPDLEGVAPTADDLGNGLCGLHLYYGDARLIPTMPHMAHHCGFVASTLHDAMTAAGFRCTARRMGSYQLLGVGVKD
jgi:predicted SAM-dependent methyltransferase